MSKDGTTANQPDMAAYLKCLPGKEDIYACKNKSDSGGAP